MRGQEKPLMVADGLNEAGPIDWHWDGGKGECGVWEQTAKNDTAAVPPCLSVGNGYATRAFDVRTQLIG
jgi:hypothetical protein